MYRLTRGDFYLIARVVFLESDVQNFVDVLDRNKFEFLFCFLRNIDQIFFVQLGKDDGGNTGAHRAQTFFLQAANRQNESAQSDLTGVLLKSEASAVNMATPADGPSFGTAPAGTCT